MKTLEVSANTQFAEKVMEFVESELTNCNYPDELWSEIIIAVEEIFINIATYAYNPEHNGNVKISVAVDKKVVIQFEDSGRPFNPLEADAPDLDGPIKERKIGGLGIHFVKNMMDDARYTYTDGKNILTIIKDMVN